MSAELLNSPLHYAHIEAGAKFAEFGGWNMPLSYSEGTLSEHHECRSKCAIFDVSHLGSVRVSGSESFNVLQRTFTNDLDRITPGKAQYSHLLNDNGGVMDDVIIWWISEFCFEIMPNASNTMRVVTALENMSRELEIIETTRDRAVIAVQGPKAREVLASISTAISSVPRFCVEQIDFLGSSITVAGTGYTGEDGVEISVPLELAVDMWSQLVQSGASPSGLGARDTLRLEAGLPLHGNELGPQITPIEANLKWVVSMKKSEFLGKEAIKNQLENGVKKKLYGLATSERRPPRSGQVVSSRGAEIGIVTSGNYSPTLKHGIAMALLPPTCSIDDKVFISGRRDEIEATIVSLPFYKS
ncbi:MAG: glycine cleavage system aminomethyltransferase GcvT [Acidimicrobiales bacterium]|nr:glycine cleavage system aminomethyltransferase GcvT [Acidimicrobiales bacterium]MDP6299029.1 glycine cleavage system aminomethyltransferase GcvT [Acidimicrobiales bacterium]HJM28767.1 glycine cleavage system aminomethyltransferase GcvT [Acidimicrobiales bacterium]HJM98504.1 glycine cleavage system aminomethyltransferase GcvT [Acidimicrobiales bacterium]